MNANLQKIIKKKKFPFFMTGPVNLSSSHLDLYRTKLNLEIIQVIG